MCEKKNSYQTSFSFLPSPPALGGGPVTLPHDTHSDTVFQQAVDTISVIQHSSAVTLLLAFVLSAGDKETHHQKKQTGVHVIKNPVGVF